MWLIVFGLWSGDILYYYGVVLFVFRNVAPLGGASAVIMILPP
jgi:hypothetical protein